MDETIDKGSFDDSRLELWAPLIKGHKGTYTAILSDDSIDRDGEIVGKEAMIKIKDDETFLAALMDHENKILNQVGEWVNRRVETIDGHTTLMADVNFFKSNPNAVIIEGMLKEGAKMGVSIGAIVKEKEERKIMGKTRTVFTELELLEASFVAIPSNRHAHALAVAKSYQKNKEVKKMTEEEKKPVEEEAKVEEESKVEEPEAEKKVDSEKLESLNKEFSEFKESAETKEAEYKESLKKVTSELETTKKDFEELKAAPFHKSKQELEAEVATAEKIEVAAKKEIEAGKIPVLRK